MPKKSHRMAARQAQLRQQGRKGRGKPQAPPTPPVPSPSANIDGSVEVEPVPEITRPEPKVEARPEPSARPARGRAATPAAYRYISLELKRIALLAGVVLAALAVFTFFLR